MDMAFSIFHFVKHYINEGETTRGEREQGQNDSRGETTRIRVLMIFELMT